MTEANDEIIDDVTDVTDDNTDGGTEQTRNAGLFAKYGVDPDNASTDDLLRIIKRNEKAESRIVADKKTKPEPKSETSDVMTKADYAMEKFLDKNPELSEYTKELSSYTKKGISLDEAKTLVLNSDKAKQSRDKTNSLGLSDGEDTGNKRSTISRKELDKIADTNQAEYNRIRIQMDSWKVKLV